MLGQEPLEHPICTLSQFLYLEKDEGRVEKAAIGGRSTLV